MDEHLEGIMSERGRRKPNRDSTNELDFDALDEFFWPLDEESNGVWEPVEVDELVINPLDLPEEWIKQPVLYDRAIVAVKDARRSMDAAKEDMDLIISETKIELRTTKSKDKDTKVTEKYVEEMAAVDPHVTKAKRLYNVLSQQYGLMVSRVRSVEMKKKALENLTTLVIGQLYSLPKEGRTIKNVKNLEEAARKRSNQEHRERLAISKLRRQQKPSSKPKRRDEDLTEEEILEAKSRISTAEVADEMEKRIRQRRDRVKQQQEEEQENKSETKTPNRRRRSRNR
jgi:hypothetical protein